ncbi:MAG: hypothetical protein NPIRA02_13150 [Nitrospirales bacterium]|nr:MAG: hypothetical protein NPIRA02_13150 [Nitrospirales bacterium]
MRVCLICVEFFGWGKYGGFGRAARLIGRELVNRGVEVFAVVPRRQDQKPREEVDGIHVLSFSPLHPWSSRSLYAQCDADVYHSCEPSFGTYLAMKAMPQKKHVVTMRDTRDHVDWKMEYALPSIGKLQVLSNYLYEDNPLVRKAVQKAHGVYCAAHLLIPKVKEKYTLLEDPSVLPTPVVIPQTVQKADKPTVCFMGRWDRRKRPELFLQLAESFPDVQFIAVGSSRDRQWDAHLRKTFAHVPNLDMPGFVDQFDSTVHSRILEHSWILVNTATREGLPNSFLEAAAHGCAILSAVNPDGFASDFGYHVTDGRFDKGLKYLLEHRRWEERGILGRVYVQKNFELNHAISLHLALYERLLNEVVTAG